MVDVGLLYLIPCSVISVLCIATSWSIEDYAERDIARLAVIWASAQWVSVFYPLAGHPIFFGGFGIGLAITLGIVIAQWLPG